LVREKLARIALRGFDRSRSMRPNLLVLTCLTAAAACVSGCGKERESGAGQACGDYVDKLRGCGLLSAGSFNCDYFEDDPVVDCYLNCAVSAACQEVEQDLCYGSSTELDNCYLQCLETYGFACQSGTEIILSVFACDGVEDCSAGSDEAGRNPIPEDFQCADGFGSVPLGFRCNGVDECNDGSDEVGCPPDKVFYCPDGSDHFSVDNVCDGYTDCTDGADEEGCAEVLCN